MEERLTNMKQNKISKYAKELGKRGGFASARNMTPEERMARSQKASKAKSDKKWEPKNGDVYFTPEPSFIGKCDNHHWWGAPNIDVYYSTKKERGLIFRTKEEAIEACDKIIAFVQGGMKGI